MNEYEMKIMKEVDRMVEQMTAAQIEVLQNIVDVLEITKGQLATGESVVAFGMVTTIIDTVKKGIDTMRGSQE
tara:strand:- start:74 stop:292 length:219 start_codon:yes stop_codon:yes gene_type:complete